LSLCIPSRIEAVKNNIPYYSMTSLELKLVGLEGILSHREDRLNTKYVMHTQQHHITAWEVIQGYLPPIDG